jgi:hypothetical protein
MVFRALTNHFASFANNARKIFAPDIPLQSQGVIQGD